MPITSPTAAQIKAKFPALAAIADATVSEAIAEAVGFVDISQWAREDDYTPALAYLTAHILVISGNINPAASGASAGLSLIQAGVITEARVGDVAVKSSKSAQQSAGDGGGGMSTLDQTPFGQRFLEYRRRNIFAPLVV